MRASGDYREEWKKRRRRRRSSGILGTVLRALGAGLLGVGSWLLARERNGRRPETPPTPGLGIDDFPISGSPEKPGTSDTPWESFAVPGPEGGLHVRRMEGEDRLPVLFVHGLAGHGRHWRTQMLSLAGEGHPVAAPDLRGHGRSDPSGTLRYGIEDYAEDLSAVVEALGWRRFVFVAHSLGAAVCIEHGAENDPGGRVAGLFLVDPNGDMTGADDTAVEELVEDVRVAPHREFELHFHQFLAQSPAEVSEAVLADLVATPPEVLAESFEASMTYPTLRRLRELEMPVELLASPLNRGDRSLWELAREIPSTGVPRVGHWIMLDRPRAVTRRLREFLASLD
ncbi:MAG: alpha/beta hydrolase [Thermoanaerobaculia bacterium]|nr:alpha/beta hydrolase [Thermoanaerobaculia bacterium]